jgi:hypothetical protein
MGEIGRSDLRGKRPGGKAPRPHQTAAPCGRSPFSGPSVQDLVIPDGDDVLALSLMDGAGDLDLFPDEVL